MTSVKYHKIIFFSKSFTNNIYLSTKKIQDNTDKKKSQ